MKVENSQRSETQSLSSTQHAQQARVILNTYHIDLREAAELLLYVKWEATLQEDG